MRHSKLPREFHLGEINVCEIPPQWSQRGLRPRGVRTKCSDRTEVRRKSLARASKYVGDAATNRDSYLHLSEKHRFGRNCGEIGVDLSVGGASGEIGFETHHALQKL